MTCATSWSISTPSESELLRRIVTDPDDLEAREAYAQHFPKSEDEARDGLLWLSPRPRVIHGLLAAPERFHLYYYQDAPGLRSALEGAARNPALMWCTRLYLGYSTSLEAGAEKTLLASPYNERIEELELHETYVSPAQLQELSKLPGLKRLLLTGGMSQDWGGMIFEWPSIGPEHLEVLKGSPLDIKLEWQGSLTLPSADKP